MRNGRKLAAGRAAATRKYIMQGIGRQVFAFPETGVVPRRRPAKSDDLQNEEGSFHYRGYGIKRAYERSHGAPGTGPRAAGARPPTLNLAAYRTSLPILIEKKMQFIHVLDDNGAEITF
ncbi:hypothetical protein EVAR_75168_1 [Eumeta japonica]|uniref:Uncharacterized protein n=1 Tax=Eumeta variegata TaxID=151549 RepID=A0A4C1U0K7_EUMVA|nr:hypothetical protein EVAR_75168_1 [Eumeta japonica]